MKEKNLPNNLEAEESVLGACFLSKYALQKASESLHFIMKKMQRYFLQCYHYKKKKHQSI